MALSLEGELERKPKVYGATAQTGLSRELGRAIDDAVIAADRDVHQLALLDPFDTIAAGDVHRALDAVDRRARARHARRAER